MIADFDPVAAAGASADRVNRLLQTGVARGVELDATDERALEAFLSDVDSFLSAVPCWLNPKITAGPADRDFVIIRIKAVGEKDGRAAEATVELFDYYDEATGFSAMERTTGWDGAIVAIMNAHGVTPRGVKPVEVAVPVAPFVAEMRRRGFALTERISLY